jgi:hypothetical protein
VRWGRLEAIDAYEVDPGAVAAEAGLVECPAADLPEQQAELEAGEADLLLELPAERLLVRLSFLPAAAGRGPPVTELVAVAEEQDPVLVVDDRGADGLALG